MVDSGLNSVQLDCAGLEGLENVARKITEFAGKIKIWAFEAEMGAGKTTLIRELCHGFEVVDNVSSPTFSIVNEYQNNRGEVFYHFDFYRVKDESEAMDMGCEEYFYSGDYCFIEWPSKVSNLLPDQYMQVTISVIGEACRSFELTRYG